MKISDTSGWVAHYFGCQTFWRKEKKYVAFCLLFFTFACYSWAGESINLKEFYAVKTFQEAPGNIEILSETTEAGIKTISLKFDGGMINGKPTRIFAYYSRPEAQGVYPAVLVIHGAGLGVLRPNIEYCKQGFATLTIDWAGKCPERKEPRKPPYSEFEVEGCMGKYVDGKWILCNPSNDIIRVGVIFARRSLEFLRNQPEIDKDNLFTVGASAGAHLSLILLGVEPGIKASVVKYGTGFIRDIPGSFGGYFGPILCCKKEDQDKWLAYYDPKEAIPNYRAKVLLLSGTDDIFFWMRNVLMTYHAIPTEKRLLIRPNDNHNWIGNDPVSAKFILDAYHHQTLEWPDAPAPTVNVVDGKMIVTVTPSTKTPLKEVNVVWKSSLLGFFEHSKNWKVQKGVAEGNVWVATMDAPVENQQFVAYAMLTDEKDRIASTDTVEVPEFPCWRGKTTPAQTLDNGNFFMNPSFDWQLKPQTKGWALLGGNAPKLVSTPGVAHSGKNAILIKKGGCLRYTVQGLPAGKYKLSFWSKCLSANAEPLNVRTMIRVRGKNNSVDRKVAPRTEYKCHELETAIPDECESFTLELWGGNTGDVVVDDFSLDSAAYVPGNTFKQE